MKSCLKPNFSKESYSGDIDFSTLQGENIDEILANIETMLEGTPFSTSLDSSQDVDTYQDSISSLIDTIIEKLDKKEGLPFELNRSAKSKIRSFFKGKLLPRPLTKTEQSIQAVIAGSDLITEDERRSLRLSRTLREIYGNNDVINFSRQSQFDEEMRIRTIIDVARRRIIDTQDDLNDGIMKYQSEQFKIIRDFLKTLGFDLSEVPQSLYRSKGGNETVKVLQRNYTNALLMMYNYIKSKRESGQLDQILEDGWEAKIFNREGTLEYDAINAYVNLNYFDDILKECFGDYINIDYNYDQPIVIEQNDGSTQVSYKYSFARGNVNAVKTWGPELQDALKEMSKFQQILIKSIPIYNYDTRSIETGRLQPKDFVGSISKLLDVGAQVINDQEFRKAVNTFQDLPTKSLETIFKRLFENRNNTTLLNELEKLGLDSNNINFLYSIYKTVFKGKDSWKTIEDEYIRDKGLTQRYNLIDTLLGVMDSNVAMNYAQTTYDYDSGMIETSIKARYSANRTKFDIVNSVNSLTIDRADKSDILSRFGIKTSNRKDYTITINVNGVDTDFGIVCRDKKNLLDKGPKSSKIDVPAIDVLLSKVDLSTIDARERLVSREGLNEDEQKFMAVLDFIDTMFENTFFGRDIDGLKELHLVTKMNKSNFKEMFLSAARALLVTDIYNQFEQATKENGGKYSRTELLKFLDDNDVYADKIQSVSNKNKKEYFIQRYDGYQLNTLRATQLWIEDLAKVRAILAGDTSKSVIANLDGDKIPNFGPGYLGARIEQQLTRSHNAAKATSHLLFVTNPTAIKAKVVNTDVVTKDGLKKQIKNMTEGELLYDAIVNKFIAPFLKDQSVYTQPTTFSDKTKFILYKVSLESLGIERLSSSNFNQSIEQKIIDTIGASYKEVYAQVLDDYARIFPEYVTNGQVDLDLVQKWLKTHREGDEILEDNAEEFDEIRPNGTKIRYGITTRALRAGVTVYKDVHYRQIVGKNLSINELLYEYANNLYTPEALHRRLEFEKLNFINDILSKRLGFEVNYDSSGNLDRTGNEMTRMLIKLTDSGDEGKSWVRGNRMALARVRNTKTGRVRKVTHGHISLQPDEVFEINPVLNAFFMLDNLIGNNLRYSLTGSEINHKVKALAKLDLNSSKTIVDGVEYKMSDYMDFIMQYNPGYRQYIEEQERIAAEKQAKTGKFQSVNRTITFYDISRAIENFGRSLGPDDTISVEEERIINGLMKIYNDNIYKIENGAQNAQFKRNVIIPGTMRYYLQGRLNGIRNKMKVAVINDLGADVFNFDGLSASIDAHDGSACVNPFSSILENNSLQDCEVGTVKKPIQHWYDDRYMSATLLKYAIDTITNQWMRQSEGNQTETNKRHGIVLRNVFKKMTNIRWHNPDGSWKFGEINLIDGCEFRNNPRINFLEHIAEKNGDIKGLFYRDGLDHKKIHDFGIENGVYYTIEYSVDNTGTKPYDPKKIYHYFENDGTHVRSETFLEDPNLHTIDSLFELHTALGGIYSESLDSNGELQYSEASNYAVAQFINNVATLKEGADPNVLTQDSYYQPLKQAMIDVLANNSAVKNGAGNINPTSSFYDDTEFSYIEIGTNGYGIQMDADHTADEGHMTEFSQVISSLDAGGRLHGYVSQIYKTLGKLAVDLSEVELDAIDEFRETGNLSAVYDVVGRTIMNNLSKNRGQAGLANAIIDAIKEKFNLNTDHALDEFKIPFSDPNIYSTILSTFVSVINKKSIKRQYPGLGTVMVPGYDISMIYEIDGQTYQYEDLLKLAIQAGYTSTITDLSQRNRVIVSQYLQSKQNELPVYQSSEVFQPTDNVKISYNVAGTGETKMIEVSLNNIDDYYTFKNDIVAFLNGKGVINPTNISYQKNILVPRNLAPVKISWEYDDETGHHYMNIFDSWAIKGLYLYQKEIDQKVKAKQLSKKEGEKLKEAKHKELTPLIQKTFDDLDKGIYYRSPDDTVGVQIYSIDEEGNRQNRASNKAAEMIMSNLYKSKFGLQNGDSLADVMSEGVNYFKKRLMEQVVPVVSDNYDLVYTKLDNRNLYITFKPLHQNDENFDSTKREWENKIPKEFTYPEGYTGPKTIVNRVYAATNNNIALFEIGREILREDVQYDETKKKFVDKTGRVLPNQKSFRRQGKDKVLEYIEFISNNQVIETGETTIKYDLYNINRNAIKRVLLRQEYSQEQLTRQDKKTGETYTITPDQKFDEEVNNFISHLLADVYHTKDFNGMQVNSKVTLGSAYVLQHTLYGLGEQLKYDNDLFEYIRGSVNEDGTRTSGLIDLVNSGKAADGYVTYSNRIKNRILGQYRDKLAQKQFTSFKKSQEFTVSRIPAQTLQSFMQMRNVGFTGVPTNQCFVSHWQTWLQGSDY